MSSLPANPADFHSTFLQRVAAHKLTPYLFIALAAALYLFPFIRVLTWCPDEGISEYGAQLILNGGMPGRDFVELYAPGSYYWLALLFKIFGTSVATARGLLLAEGIGTAVLIFHLSRRLGGIGLFAMALVLTTSIPMELMNSPHYDADLFALLSLAIFLAAERSLAQRFKPETGAYVLLFFASLLAGWTSCILQEKGLYLACAYTASLILLRCKRRFLLFAIVWAGFLLPLFAEVSWYAMHGALPDLIYWNFVLPLRGYHKLNAVHYGFPLWEITIPKWFAGVRGVFPLPIAIAFVAVLSVPFATLLLLPLLTPVLGYFERSLAFRREWIPYWLAGFAIVASELHRLDIGHLRNGCIVLAVLFFSLCDLSRRRWLKPVALAIAACVVLFGAVNLMGAAAATTPIRTRRGTLFAEKTDGVLQFLLSHTRPGDYVFIYPHRPVYYFLAGVRNPTRSAVFIYDEVVDNLFREAVRKIDERKARYALWDTFLSDDSLTMMFPAYHPLPPERRIIEQYLKSHYHQIGFVDGFRILERSR